MKSPLALFAFALLPVAAGFGGEIDAKAATGDAPPVSAPPQYAPQAPQYVPPVDTAVGAQNGATQAPPADEYSDTDPSAVSDFRPVLDPYGAWAEDSTYGTVWTPSATVVGGDFAPYVSAGHWTYDDEYTWVSDYSWGWAPFHYGRWVYIGGRGWSWVPGRTYAGAWVSWRTGYDDYGYVGWGPMPPTYYWYGGVAYGISVVPNAAFVFCPSQSLFSPHVGGQIVVGSQVGVVASHTRPYQPAAPAVAAGGRVTAHPSVGPTPQSVHIAPAAIAHVSLKDPGLSRARAYASVSSAVASGARAPIASPRSLGAPQSVGGSHASLPPAPARTYGNAHTYAPSLGYASPRPNAVAQPPSPRYTPSYSPRAFAPSYSAPRTYVPPPSYTPHYAPSPSYVPHYAPSPSYAPHTYVPSPSYGSSAPSFGSQSFGNVGPHPGTAPAPAPAARRSSGGEPPPASHSGGTFHGAGRGFRR